MKASPITFVEWSFRLYHSTNKKSMKGRYNFMKGGTRKKGSTWYYYFDLGKVNGKRKKKERYVWEL